MKLKDFFKKYFSPVSIILIGLAFLSVVILIISKFSCTFSDYFNRYISSGIRFVLSHITGVLPFSLGETLFILLPLILITVLILYFKVYSKDDIKSGRYIVGLFSCVSVMVILYVFTFGVAYGATSLDVRLDLDKKDVSAEELKYTADSIYEEISAVLSEIDYRYDGSSKMPYSYDELNEKLNLAYNKISDEYDFIPKLRSNVKLISLSPLMTYTHISGVFAYYTGEANVNFNYPEYTAPFTMAHEMAHQRGVASEDEANFVAFLVCRKSDDPFIRYSGCLSVLEYVMSALNSADISMYNEFSARLDVRVRGEFIAFSNFFTQYRNSTASKVTNTINDTYLKASGVEGGTKSYGMVVDLACAYYKNDR